MPARPICHFFMNGGCRNGSRCDFRHTLSNQPRCWRANTLPNPPRCWRATTPPKAPKHKKPSPKPRKRITFDLEFPGFPVLTVEVSTRIRNDSNLGRRACLERLKHDVITMMTRDQNRAAIKSAKRHSGHTKTLIYLATHLLRWKMIPRQEIKDLVILGILMPREVFAGYVNALFLPKLADAASPQISACTGIKRREF